MKKSYRSPVLTGIGTIAHLTADKGSSSADGFAAGILVAGGDPSVPPQSDFCETFPELCS